MTLQEYFDIYCTPEHFKRWLELKDKRIVGICSNNYAHGPLAEYAKALLSTVAGGEEVSVLFQSPTRLLINDRRNVVTLGDWALALHQRILYRWVVGTRLSGREVSTLVPLQ